MVLKERDQKNSETKYGIAGEKAENQMAYYLQRAFGESEDIIVLNDIRIEDSQGMVAQMDHLVIHEYGFVVIESKSVTTKVSINDYGEWIRHFNGKSTGMRSPIKQAQMQTDILKRVLESNKEKLFKKTLSNKLFKTSFNDYPFDIFVAISDTGIIQRPEKLDTSMVLKADLVCDAIQDKIDSYRKKSKAILPIDLPSSFYQTTMLLIAEFLKSKHTPAHTENKNNSVKDHTVSYGKKALDKVHIEQKENRFTCKKCMSDKVKIVWGKYGYYFKCVECQGNTPIKLKCKDDNCMVKLKKDKNNFYQICETCNTKVLYFVNQL
jgi:hypothetical protein